MTSHSFFLGAHAISAFATTRSAPPGTADRPHKGDADECLSRDTAGAGSQTSFADMWVQHQAPEQRNCQSHVANPSFLSSMPVKHRRFYRGFTIIELMVVVSIMAILMALAAPSFSFLIERWRVLQAVDGLKTTLYYGRSEAIKRGTSIYVEKIPKASSSGCISDDTAKDWDCGWVVFVDANNNQRWDAGEEVQRFDAPRNIKVTRTESVVTITVNRWGSIDGGGVLGFTLSPSSNASSTATKGVCMTPAGRIRVINQEDVPCT